MIGEKSSRQDEMVLITHRKLPNHHPNSHSDQRHYAAEPFMQYPTHNEHVGPVRLPIPRLPPISQDEPLLKLPTAKQAWASHLSSPPPRQGDISNPCAAFRQHRPCRPSHANLGLTTEKSHVVNEPAPAVRAARFPYDSWYCSKRGCNAWPRRTRRWMDRHASPPLPRGSARSGSVNGKRPDGNSSADDVPFPTREELLAQAWLVSRPRDLGLVARASKPNMTLAMLG